jgi:hypothetical protein
VLALALNAVVLLGGAWSIVRVLAVLPPTLEALSAQETFQLYVPSVNVTLKTVVVAFSVETLDRLYALSMYKEQLYGLPKLSETLKVRFWVAVDDVVESAGDINVTVGLAVST